MAIIPLNKSTTAPAIGPYLTEGELTLTGVTITGAIKLRASGPAFPAGMAGPDADLLLLNEKQAAKRLGFSGRSLYDLRKKGKIGYVPYGDTGIRYTIDQLEAWIKSARVDPVKESEGKDNG